MTVDGKFMRGNIALVYRATVCDPLIGVSIGEPKSRATSSSVEIEGSGRPRNGGKKGEKEATR